jgi:hypothetical protein
MSTKKSYVITGTGQLIEVVTSKSVITNPSAILASLTQLNAEPVVVEQNVGSNVAYHNLGDGVSVHQQKFGSTLKTFGAIQLKEMQFYTTWELVEKAGVNDGKHYLTPSTQTSTGMELGAPLILPVPDDLVIHFVVEWNHPQHIDVVKPTPQQLHDLPRLLRENRANYYLTCFSLSRNTCVRLPVPNLYDDCHLCVGNSFHQPGFMDVQNHNGIVSSLKATAKAWSETGWNLDLLGGRGSRRMLQYQRLVRFDADSVSALPFSGCGDWPMSTSSVPLEDLYRPWLSANRAVQPVILEGEENLADGTIAEEGAGEPRMVVANPFAAEAGGADGN